MPTYLPELPNMLGTITAPRTQLVASVKPKELRYRMAVPLLTSVTLLIISAAGNTNLSFPILDFSDDAEMTPSQTQANAKKLLSKTI